MSDELKGLWKPSGHERQQMSVVKQVGIGMLCGLLGPFVIPLINFTLPRYNPTQLRMVVLFGPVFGGMFAYFIHRFRRFERSVGTFWFAVFAGGLAGGATASLAYDFGYLTELWQVGAGALGGALLIVFISRM